MRYGLMIWIWMIINTLMGLITGNRIYALLIGVGCLIGLILKGLKEKDKIKETRL